jgi:tryptophan 2,3-dioxygenase
MRPVAGRPGKAKQSLHSDKVNPLLRYEFDRGSNYETDTRVTQALMAVITDTDLSHQDQRFFQLNHLITEYSWALVHDSLVKAYDGIEAGLLPAARRAVDRAIQGADIPLHCVRELQDFLPQVSLLAMRAIFPPNTTGLDSPGMRNLRRACRGIWAAFTERAEAAGLTPADLLAEPATWDHVPQAAALADVMAALYRLDNRVLEWKRAHLQLVWMTVGGGPGEDAVTAGPSSIRGAAVSDLDRMASRPMFPELWDLTTRGFARLATGSGPYARTD